MAPPESSPNVPGAATTPVIRSGGGVSLWLKSVITAVLATLLPLTFWALVLAATVACLWHGHRLVHAIVLSPGYQWSDAVAVLAMILEGWACILLVRQLLTPEKKESTWQELHPGDQPQLFRMVHSICDVLRVPQPRTISVDSSSSLQLDTASVSAAVLGKGGRLQIGLSLQASVSQPSFAGLLAHELAFFSKGRASGAFRLIRAIEEWFVLRLKHDPWIAFFKKNRSKGGKLRRMVTWFAWASTWLASRPLRVLFGVFEVIARPAMRKQVQASDQCGAALIGGTRYAHALEERSQVSAAWERLETRLKEKLESPDIHELPESVPLLVARCHLTSDSHSEIDPKRRSHWLFGAETDSRRIQRLAHSSQQGMWSNDGEATTLVVNFHEQARRATAFHYQNDWGLVLSHLRYVTVEESLFAQRSSVELVTAMNRYFRGLAHPERAFCGIAKAQAVPTDDRALKRELAECREWLAKYGDRMTTALSEWSKTWRLVRDLEAAYVLSKAGMQIQKHQFSVDTPDALKEEIEHQRTAMENMESLLKDFEGRLETRMACCLELLWREPAENLPGNIAEIRQTLPHWVLIYEALGVNLPQLRELITSYHAFHALGVLVSGTVESASYITTVQNLMPQLADQVSRMAKALEKWPYPFKVDESNERITLTQFLGARLHEMDAIVPSGTNFDAVGDRRVMAQDTSRMMLEVVAPFIERYLNLYHQAFAWVSRAAQLAEWHFNDPMAELAARDARREAEDAEAKGIPMRAAVAV